MLYSRKEDVPDEEVLQLMYDGGVRLCDHAIDSWASGKYDGGQGSDELKAKFLADWRAKKQAIRGRGKRLLAANKNKESDQ